ncbi:MAG: ABC transporter permease, partial [Terriglobales bacterium]
MGWSREWRQTIRALGRTPGFTAVAIAMLALGIGANVAIFSVVNAALLAPLPFAQPRQLVFFRGLYSYPNYRDLRARSGAFAGVAGYTVNNFTLTGRGRALHVRGGVTAGALFQVLGVRPALGRGFRISDDRPGAAGGADPVILSHGLWERLGAGAGAAVGQRILLNQRDYQVIGVMPAGFAFPMAEHEDLWTTVSWVAAQKQPPTQVRELPFLTLIARLRSSTTIGAAQTAAGRVAAQLRQEYPRADNGLQVQLVSARQKIEGPVEATLWMLFAAVGLVLLIACVNVANLLLARAAGRRREMAVRAALGAGQGQLVRQQLRESVVLGIGGGLVGLCLAAGAVAGLVRLAPPGAPRLAEAGINLAVAAFALALGLGSGLLAGWLPAATLRHADLGSVLQAGGRGATASRRQQRWRSALVVAEFALTLALLASAGLLVQSLVRLQGVAPGFQPRHLLTAAVGVPEGYKNKSQFFLQLTTQVAHQPGIIAAAAAHSAPFTGHAPMRLGINWLLHPQPPAEQPQVPFDVVTPGYFRTLEVPMLAGRAFTLADRPQDPEAIIVNRAFARAYLGGANPVGQQLTVQFGPVQLAGHIVGEAEDIRRVSLRQPAGPMLYFTEAQFPAYPDLTVLVRTRQLAASAAGVLRAVARRLDAAAPVYA